MARNVRGSGHSRRRKHPGGRTLMKPESATGQLWAVVLAGGEGVQLRPLIRRLYGEDRPKQFAAVFGSRSLLHQALDRVRLAVAAERTVLVTLKNHDGYLAEALNGTPVRRLLVQPEDKGTAAGVLLPTHWIHWCDPEAIIIVFPSDHFIGKSRRSWSTSPRWLTWSASIR